MIANTEAESRTLVATPPGDAQAPDEAATAGQGQFDDFESSFFRAGEDIANLPGALDHDDDLDDGVHRRPMLSRSSLLGLTIGSTCLALLACTALWRSNAPVSPVPSADRATLVVAPAGAPSPPAHLAPAATPATAATPSPAPVPAEETPVVASVQPNDGATTSAGEEGATASTGVKAEEVPEAATTTSDARERCTRSIRERRKRAILASCPTAFAEDASDVDIAIALAKVEFDRGRYAQAQAWGKKAIAIDPDTADAYVFVGGAQQSKGRGRAAKAAYLHYLRLAPSGRYAAELRTIVRSL